MNYVGGLKKAKTAAKSNNTTPDRRSRNKIPIQKYNTQKEKE